MLTACRQMREWGQDGTVHAPISVNISTRQLLTPGFQGMVESVLREAGLDPNILVLEIPESLQHRQAVACATPLRALRSLGVRVALDSFGGEGRSLASVHDIPADIWKIDQSFVQQAADDEVISAILSTMIELGQRLDIQIVVKGVETHAQIESLRARGATVAQGLILCSPMPALSVCKWVRTQQAA
jgi:EAL domain-containing protein (putative c-di-GMP-specific phosphodiesterase class I)